MEKVTKPQLSWTYYNGCHVGNYILKTKFSTRPLIDNNRIVDIGSSDYTKNYCVTFYRKFAPLNDLFPKDLKTTDRTLEEIKEMVERYLLKLKSIRAFL